MKYRFNGKEIPQVQALGVMCLEAGNIFPSAASVISYWELLHMLESLMDDSRAACEAFHAVRERVYIYTGQRLDFVAQDSLPMVRE